MQQGYNTRSVCKNQWCPYTPAINNSKVGNESHSLCKRETALWGSAEAVVPGTGLLL